MNKTEYIGKLNALYVGEKNCLEELITIYDEKDKEIERLNNIIDKYEKMSFIHEIELQKTIDKAIEYIENKNKFLDEENYYQVFEYRDIYLMPLLDILKGSDKDCMNS